MSLLLRWKLSPLKKLFPSLTSPFSTSIRLYAPKTREEKLDDLKKGEELYKKFEKVNPVKMFALLDKTFPFLDKTNPIQMFLLQGKHFDPYQENAGMDLAAARQEYLKLSEKVKSEFKFIAECENERRESVSGSLARKERNLLNEFREAKEKGTVDELKMEALATNLPLKIRTPWALYVQEKHGHHGESFKLVTQALVDNWQSLPEPEKKIYYSQMADANKDHEAKYEKWVETLSAEERELFGRKGQKYLTKAQRSALVPLVPLTPYQAFVKDAWASKKLEGEDGARKKQYVKEIAAKWRAMSPSERKDYKSKSQ